MNSYEKIHGLPWLKTVITGPDSQEYVVTVEHPQIRIDGNGNHVITGAVKDLYTLAED